MGKKNNIPAKYIIALIWSCAFVLCLISVICLIWADDALFWSKMLATTGLITLLIMKFHDSITEK